MAIRSDSYGSTDEVRAYTRHLLDGAVDFSASTRPTLTEVEKFIDRASGILNSCILGAGFAPANIAANSTAKLPCDDWVVTRAARMTELTQRGTGYDGSEGSRLAGFDTMTKDACNFVDAMSEGWKQLGITVSKATSEGLAFTALDEHSQRSDPDDTTREQPAFRRRQFTPWADSFDESD